MKITFVTSGSIKSNFTYRALQLSRSLQKLGHQVTIITPSADKYNNFIPEKITSIDGVKIIQPFQFKTKRLEINLLPYIFHAIYLILKNKSDLIYIYKPTPISAVGLIGKFIYGTQVVLDMDDLGSEVMRIEGHPFYQIKLVELCEKIVAKYCDKIVTASTYLEQYYKNQFQNKPIIVISNAVDIDWFKPIVSSDEKKRIVFLGSLNRKNILEPLFNVLPNIVKQVPDLKVLIMGDGKFLNYFKKMADDLSLEKHVEFTGWLNILDAQNRLMAGDIGYNYMPDEITTKSASNMKVPQYMARGVVPFVSDVGDLPSYVEYGKYGYVCKSNDINLLENKLIDALNDKERLIKSKEIADFSMGKFNWDVLSERFINWFLGKKLDNQKKNKIIYFVTITVPGNVGGAEIRNFNLLRQWSMLEGAKVRNFCISTENKKGDKENLKLINFAENHLINKSRRTFFSLLRSILIKRLPPFMEDFRASRLQDSFRAACEAELPDIVHLEQIHAYYSIIDQIPWLKSKGVKIVLDCHNVEYQAFEDSLNIFPFYKKIVGKYILKNLKKLETEGVHNSDAIFCCSDIDAKFFSNYNKNTFVIPNGVDVKEFKNERTNFNSKVIFIGGVGYPPNEDAIIFYLNEIHPIVKKDVPDVKFLAIGLDNEWLKNSNINDDSILALGYVDDVKPYLKDATVGVCPIRYGSGTRLKILTYMASSLPVVSTHKGAEGVNYINDVNIIMEDDPEYFARKIVKLIKDNSYAKEIGINGFEFVSKNYDWETIGEGLRYIYKKI